MPARHLSDQPPARTLLLDGAANFRDFGGYPAAGGKRVRWRRLFRSNKLSALTARDCGVLDGFGIHTVFDLRSRAERERDPTVWIRETMSTRTFRPGHKRRLVDMALDYPSTGEGIDRLMHDFYSEMPFTMAHVFAELIDALAEGATPCIIHCSAGKDRTGVAAALVLAALGVDRATMEADYAVTQEILRPDSDMARALQRDHEGDDAFAKRYSRDAIDRMMAARPSYIAAALDAIDSAHGSFGAYLRDRLQIDEGKVATLRARLLEPA